MTILDSLTFVFTNMYFILIMNSMFSFQKQFSTKCSSDAGNVEFDSNLKKMIIDLHNKMRNNVAMGKINGLLPAQQMASVVSNKITILEF